MAENSPLKRNRPQNSPRKHPYDKTITSLPAPGTTGTGRSPLRDIQGKHISISIPQQHQPTKKQEQVKKPLYFPTATATTTTTNENQNQSQGLQSQRQSQSQFSHFGGPSVFPSTFKSTTANINANSENLNGNRTLRELPLPSATSCKIYTDENAQDAVADAQMQVSASAEIPSKKPKPGVGLGVIGDRRSTSTSSASASVGFIPVEKSCVIGRNEIHTSGDRGAVTVTESQSQTSCDREWMNISCSSIQSQSVTSGVLGQLQPRGLNTSFTEKFESRLGLHSDSGEKQVFRLGGDVVRKRGLLTKQFIPLFDFPEYSTDILKYWGKVEKRIRERIDCDYMDRHKEISHKMRTILVDWIAEVSHEYDMTEETLHLACNYLDRFLSNMSVERVKLQLVGTAALLVAAKFEEMHPPDTNDYVYVTDEAYTKDQILGMEKLLLTVLQFDIMVPTAYDFAMAYCSILQLSDPIKCLAMYLVDLSLLDGPTYLRFLPSVIAAAAVVLGRYTFDKIDWDAKIQGICTHRRKTVYPCVKEMQRSFFNASSMTHTTIYEKYQSVRFCQISQAFIPVTGPWLD